MLSRLLALVLTLTFAAGSGCSAGPATGRVETREEALEIAKKAFQEAAGAQIPKFAISDSTIQGSEQEWRFFAKGVEEFARPGFHGTIIVNKDTGATKVIMGE